MLRNARLIEVEKRGREVCSRVKSPEVIAAIAAVQRATEAVLAEFREMVRQVTGNPLFLENVDLRQLAKEARSGRLILVDLRTEGEFRAGHLPRAVSKPFSLLSEIDLSDLGQRGDVVGYCRGPWCRKALEGVRVLNRRGVPSRCLRAGVIEWQTAGLRLDN